MSVTLYHPSIENGAVGKGACSHPVIDHLVVVCDEDVKHFRRLGLVDPPKSKRRVATAGENTAPDPVMVASVVPTPTVASPPEEEPGGTREDED